MALFRSPIDWNGPLRLHGVLDLLTTGYGLGTVVLVAAFALGDMTALRFVKTLSLLLFVIGSVLCVDGILGVRTRLDRTWGTCRRGGAAAMIGTTKIATGLIAMLLVSVGISL